MSELFAESAVDRGGDWARSLLFVPADRDAWVDKAHLQGADAVILDLEDSVIEAHKDRAREAAAHAVATWGERAADPPSLVVRVNAIGTGHLLSDLNVLVSAQADVELSVPKLHGKSELDALTVMVREIAADAEATPRFFPILETAAAVAGVRQIVRHPAVSRLAAPNSAGADLYRELGFTWSPDGLEYMYGMSRAIVEARAAGLMWPIGGLWQEIRDMSGLADFLRWQARLGFSGALVLHPSHVEVANDIFSPAADEVAGLKGLVEAYEASEADALRGAAVFQGAHIDRAHYKAAKAILNRASRRSR